MKQPMSLKKWYTVFLLGVLMISCSKEEEDSKEIFLKVTDAQLIYQGEISDKAGLDIYYENDTVRCLLRTVFVMEGDMLNSLKASVHENNLSIEIITKPYDNPHWDDVDQLTKVHDVKFNLVGLKKGAYNLQLTINNVSSLKNDFIIN